MEDIMNIDLYELLDILSSASVQEIKKAYRKKALKCHPDKNPDDPKAVTLFHQLSKALEILTDESARAAYNKVINAKKAAALRNRELDSRRKKLKEDLENRERQAQFATAQNKSAENKLKAEIERLRKEGSKQLEEEKEYVRAQIQRDMFTQPEQEREDSEFYQQHTRLKINWKPSQDSATADPYNPDSLTKIFSKYGEVAALILSKKKKGSALVEFTLSSAAMKAQQLEKGFISSPLTVSWLELPPSISAQSPRPSTDRIPHHGLSAGGRMFPINTQSACFPIAPDIFAKNREEEQYRDFESEVLSRMRQAQEEKRKAGQESEN